MRKAYLLVYNDALGTRGLVKAWADTSKTVITWRFDLPNCFYLISEASAAELSEELTSEFGTRGRWIVTEISDNRQGRLPPESWYLIRHKKGKPPDPPPGPSLF
jgi:hypothetical protein